VTIEQTDTRNALVKALAGQALSAARLICKIYWKIRRPLTLGVVAIILDQEHKVLLVEHSYQTGWRMPGGGVRKGESVCAALQRELKEELGIICKPKAGDYLGTFYNPVDGKHDHVTLFLINQWSHDQSCPISFEIKRWGFFDVTQMPEYVTEGTRQRLAEFFDGAEASTWW